MMLILNELIVRQKKVKKIEIASAFAAVVKIEIGFAEQVIK